ncbi:MAG TPA: metal-sulfur cluster assembly factor [Casimicrobiaceae bacterium]
MRRIGGSPARAAEKCRGFKGVSQVLIIWENRRIVKVYLRCAFSSTAFLTGVETEVETELETQQALPTEAVVREALRAVDDPEVGMSIVELGLVYRIDVAPEGVHVEMTMTTPACPMGGMILDNARAAVAAVSPAEMPVDIELVWEPRWTPDLMSDTAKQVFGWSS